jgi:GNAT superfamily N-acetyltransferase
VNLAIRRAGLPDAGAVAALYIRARRAAAVAGSIPPPKHSDEDVRDWIEHLVIPRLEVWLAEDLENRVVGMLVLNDDWVDQLYVDPALTGRGIGSQLLQTARRERPEGLRLWTFASNSGAQRFYERNGFTEVERTDGSGNEEGAPDIQYASGGSRNRSPP